MLEFTVDAPAKLNLYLDVLEKRRDGYHNLKTLFEKIDLKDEIFIKEKVGGIDVNIEPSGRCPSGKDNIVHGALERLFEEAGTKVGLDIVIKKRIPVSAGLGGGSSDAASVLKSVNERFELGISGKRLFLIAAAVGKDVPFFMQEGSFALGLGTGEVLKSIETNHRLSHVILKPDISIPTPEMYARLDKHAKRPKRHDIEEMVTALKKKDIFTLRKLYYNIFEEVLDDYAPFIEKAKALLAQKGAGPGFLSGSGPSVFCTVETREEAIQIAKAIPRADDIEVFVATTY